MSDSYRRCRYFDPEGIECDTWFPFTEVESLATAEDIRQYYCVNHRDVVSTDLAANGVNKATYIEKRKIEETLCFKMTLDELDAHIAGIEVIIEQEKLKAMTARAVKRQKIEDLTEDEREERRKIKTPRQVDPDKVKKSPGVTLKSNPLKYMIQKNGLSRENAISMLGLTESEVKMYESL